MKLTAKLLAFFVAAIAVPLGAEEPKRPAPVKPFEHERDVRAVLDDQVAAWNKADIDGFMKGYWKSEKLTFISGGSITQGWEPTRERYVKRYTADGKDKMGKLTFDEVYVEGLSNESAMVRGVFKLVRGDQHDTGRFTLVLRKLPEGWRIVHDHTSVAEKVVPKKGE